MAIQGPVQRLRGRATETAVLRNLIADARSGAGRALVLRGEAGVGKTALLECVVEAADDFRVSQVSGIESEMELAFAGLQQLCSPIIGFADQLPAPQRDALHVAFGRGTGPTPDRFLVGLAVLSLVSAATTDGPLLCVIDDAHWLDEVSVQILGFVARRLVAEPAAFLFAVRERPDGLTGLPELVVKGLSEDEARALLDSVTIAALDPLVRDRIVAETRGVPLAILDVPRSVSAAELAGGFWISGKRSSPAAIERGFTDRVRALPTATRRLLLLAAAEPVGNSALFLRAAARLGIPVDALAAAEAEGIVELGPRLRFAHPLMRSAAYRAADLDERRAIHATLAAATDPDADPDRRAWHAALAAAGPDETVATELEASAGRAQSRGGVAAAAAFLERAAVLTADAGMRGKRAIAAAQAKRDAAAPDAARELLALAEMSPLTQLDRARVGRMRAQMEFLRSRAGESGALRTTEAAAGLLEAAQALDGLDDELARETYLEALTASMYAGRLGRPGQLADIARAGRAALADVTAPSRPVDLLLSGLTTRILDGPGRGSEHLRAALDRWNTHSSSADATTLHWPYPIAQESAAHELWDDAVLQHIATETVTRARAAGALAALPPALVYRAGVHVYTGELAAAETLIAEVTELTASTGQAPVKYHSLTLAAWRGDVEAIGLLKAAAADGLAKGEGRLIGVARFTTAVLFNGIGRHREALAAARECCEYEDLGFHGWALFELIDAATHLDDRQVAAGALKGLVARAGSSGTDWGLGMAAAARALVAAGDTEANFVEAVEGLERAHIGFHVARTRLSYGEWLRRNHRRADARTQLGAAHESFTGMGAHGFAARARRALVATGDKVRKQPTTSGDPLTAQEAQIAKLAGDGLTNQEIGAQLFISTHTVEWHLRKVFVKLGISSRRQLRTRDHVY
ncbi:LuxR family transcriptional regulator [Mycobacterium sp. E740]|uniref:helix-turn-helix transcriptional regulator n=1 Tax=Mycobacterium sp. E740 TaxID=1834149 RepID=UPI0008022B0E|nr:LuxR family transcriptional regulator [Mycobacterium sp. E740]OBI78055.1 LuxR family transcriptional regulator [Mycobacterium sp. E740]